MTKLNAVELNAIIQKEMPGWHLAPVEAFADVVADIVEKGDDLDAMRARYRAKSLPAETTPSAALKTAQAQSVRIQMRNGGPAKVAIVLGDKVIAIQG